MIFTPGITPEPPRQVFRQERDILVLSFFASWCKPCKEEILYLQDLASKYAGDSVKFFLISKGEETNKVEACLAENKYTLPVLLDPYEVACKKYKLKELPTLVIIDRSGNVADYRSGYAPGDQDSLKGKLDKNARQGETGPREQGRQHRDPGQGQGGQHRSGQGHPKKRGGKGKTPKATVAKPIGK